MLTQIINGRIFTPQGWLNEGSVLMRDGKILEVTNCDLALIGANLVDARGMYIVPGFAYFGERRRRKCREKAGGTVLHVCSYRRTESCRYMRKTDGRTR